MESNTLLIGMMIGALVVIAINFAMQRKPVNLAKPVRVPLGKYLAGFETTPTPLDAVECRIDEAAYHFSSYGKDDFGRVSRAAVVNIFASEKKELLEKLASTTHISFPALGIDPKKPKPIEGYCLVIDWRDMAQQRHCVIFEYSGALAHTRAHNAVATLNRFRKPNVAPLLFNQKRCEYCDEVIRKDAIKCKHCGEFLTRNRIKSHLLEK